MTDRTEAEIRNAALEEAAQKCIDRSERVDDNAAHSACLRCAREIRALKSAPAAENGWCQKCGCGNDTIGYAHLQGCPVAVDSAKGADVVLPPLPRLIPVEHFEKQQAMWEYARAAVLADRQQRGGDAVDPNNYKGMFEAAVRALAQIDRMLGLPEDGCNSPQATVAALSEFISGFDHLKKEWEGANKARAALAATKGESNE